MPSLHDTPRPRRVAARWPISPLQRRLAGTCALLALCWGALLVWQDWRQVPAWRAQVASVTGPVSQPAQAVRALSRLKREVVDGQVRQQQLAALEQALGGWLDGAANWRLHSSRFDGRIWSLGLAGSGAAPALAEWQALAEAGGAQVTLVDAGTTLQLNFDLGGEAP